MRPLDGPQASVNNRLKRGTMDTQREREREREKPGICVQREKITETQTEDGQQQTKRGLKRNQVCRHFGSRLLTSRTIRTTN